MLFDGFKIDVEILENRYPIFLNKFSLRERTGGEGKYHGGDGLIREYVFRQAYSLCVLTERRVFQPYGMSGGQPGAKGKNLLIKTDGRKINLCSKSSIEVQPGVSYSTLTIMTQLLYFISIYQGLVQARNTGRRRIRFVWRGQYKRDTESLKLDVCSTHWKSQPVLSYSRVGLNRPNF